MDTKDRIFRLLNYKNLLYRLKSLGFKKVFSDNISDTFGISSSLVRKDFVYFGIKGSQKGGYDIETVLDNIREILGKNKTYKVIVIGTGRVGQALMNYKGFHEEGIEIVAGFDIDSKLINTDAPLPILPINQMEDFIQKNNVEIAILSVPKLASQQTVEVLKQTNIKGILNFTGQKINTEGKIIVNNINIVSELEKLIYLINQSDKAIE
jgi:redox-sensing transcriptional repressor